jgi:hypothetical protein
MILYIKDPDLDEKDGKYFTLGYLLPRSTRKIFIESIPPVNPPAQTEAPKGSRFRLKIKIDQERDHWTNNYEGPQSVEKTIEFGKGTQRTFSEGNVIGNVLMGVLTGVGAGAAVGAAGGAIGIGIGGATGAIVGAVAGAAQAAAGTK